MGNLLGTIFGPIGTIFNAIFYGPIYNVLMLIYNLIHSTGIAGGFGLSIIALTLLVRCAMIPLTRKQLKSSRAMQELAPQINALKVQYRGDPQGLMKAQQDLYKEHGYSPVSGCLPLLIQMPFLYALLFSFRTLLTENLKTINKPIYAFLPHLTALPNPYFLWIDLTKPDPLHILPFMAAFFTLIQLRMAMPVRKKAAPGAPSDPTTQATQTTMYIMPVITFIFALNFPSGLALYWTVGAMFASVQQYFLNGWGSLFLGIPGLEHLVPPPKELPTSSVALTGAGGSRLAGAGARSLVASSPAPQSEGGLRGFFRNMREMSVAAQSQAEVTAKARSAARMDATVVDSVPGENGRAANVNGTKNSSTNRRPRASSKAMLVKPANNAELSESAVQQKVTASATTTTGDSLPEIAISRAAQSNGSTATMGSASGSSTTAARPAVNAKGSKGSPSSSSSSTRHRSSNRPKGGK